MILKQIWVYLIFLLVFYPFTAYTQTTLNRLDSTDNSFGFSLSKQDIGTLTIRDTTVFSGNLDYGIQHGMFFSFKAGVGLTDDTRVTPSPIGGIGIVKVDELGDTDLEYYWEGNFGATFFREVQASTNRVLERSRILQLSGGIGILKRLETEDGQEITPFFGLSYSRYWESSEVNADLVEIVEEVIFKESVEYDDFEGKVGVEIELTPMVTGLASFRFSFEKFGAAFRIGLNFR